MTFIRYYDAAGHVEVEAEVHDDDHQFEIFFNATPWFWQATDAEIGDLARIEWAFDYAADDVAEFFDTPEWAALSPDYDKITDMFKYKEKGFGCRVDEDKALAWLKKYRPALHAKLTAEK